MTKGKKCKENSADMVKKKKKRKKRRASMFFFSYILYLSGLAENKLFRLFSKQFPPVTPLFFKQSFSDSQVPNLKGGCGHSHTSLLSALSAVRNAIHLV
jgi:hypothetical protein